MGILSLFKVKKIKQCSLQFIIPCVDLDSRSYKKGTKMNYVINIVVFKLLIIRTKK